MNINLTKEEEKRLEYLAEYAEITPEELLQSFIRDLTKCIGNGGSDERECAKDWFVRHYGRAVYVEHNGHIPNFDVEG